MTTFKNNSKYGELMFTYLDMARREEIPVSIPDVLRTFQWRFKGGTLAEASAGTRLEPVTSADVYPNGLSSDIAKQWPDGKDSMGLARILAQRAATGKVRLRAMMARVGTYQILVSDYSQCLMPRKVYIGMRSIYHMFSLVWKWAEEPKPSDVLDNLLAFSRELMLGACAPSSINLPTAEDCRLECEAMLRQSRVPGLILAILQMKTLIREMSGSVSRKAAKALGVRAREMWTERLEKGKEAKMPDLREAIRHLTLPLGPVQMKVAQEMLVLGSGETRFALGKSDAERLHQLLMSAASALVGCCVQACVGTAAQKVRSKMAVVVADSNITRIVEASCKVALGDEVLVCKAFKRAYTAHLGWLAGPLCAAEYSELVAEAEGTAPEGVADVQGFLHDLRALDAASSLNAAKVFKICPAPDVSPATAMMDRIKQIGDGNVADPEMMVAFEEELRSQILRAHIRSHKGRIALRIPTERPMWYTLYLKGEMDQVPSSEIHRYLAWENTAVMPDVSKYDPKNWKDSGLGVDTIAETMRPTQQYKKNMLTRLLFDEDCPMPGTTDMSEEHVIKMFVKAEGHKDPARAIFSSNLTDRQAQSWMEKAVEKVAIHHPSFMIGQEADVKEARTVELTKRTGAPNLLTLYYSFDISGWSAKMPGEPQRISHKIWADLYGGHLFARATEVNENAYIYMDLEGYWGWYINTHSNLEGFNGKEMTMVLIALLSLSVKRWRVKVVEMGIMAKREADMTSALLFAYIDDGLCRIDLDKRYAVAAFNVYKETVNETFSKCGFSVELSKCYPSDRFAIFLNEVYLAGRHVVHGVRAAMGISSEPTERHTSLVERVTSVATGARGAVMAGLNPLSGILLMAYHVYLHILEWVPERDPVVLSIWCLSPRTWGGLGLPNTMQMFVSGSGAAFEEGVATMQRYARISPTVEKYFETMCRTALDGRTAIGVLTAPLSSKVTLGHMSDNRVAIATRKALIEKQEEGELSSYAERLLKYADSDDFAKFADAIVPLGSTEVLQEQMLTNLAEAHPHSIFASFAQRLEKATTVVQVVGRGLFQEILTNNRADARSSVEVVRVRLGE